MSLTSRLERFEGGSLPSGFLESAGSGASFDYSSNRYVEIDRGPSGNGVILTLDEAIATTEWATLSFAWESVDSDFRTCAVLADADGASGEIDADVAQSTFESKSLVLLQGNEDVDIYRIVYWDDTGTQHWWDGSAWVTSAANTGAVPEKGDFIHAAIQIDGTNERWRVVLRFQQPGTESNHGHIVSVGTTWVDFSATRAATSLKLGIGHYPTGAADQVTRLEYVHVNTGAPVFGYGNGKDSSSDYKSYSAIGVGEHDQPGGVIWCARHHTNTQEIPLGAGGAWDDTSIRGHAVAAKTWPLANGDTVYAAYEGSDGATDVGFASATLGADLLPGSWTKDGANPTGWSDAPRFPRLVYDPNSSKWYVFYTDQSASPFKIVVRSTSDATPIGATWSAPTTILQAGASGWDSEHVNQPVILPPKSGRAYWVMYYAGAEAGVGAASQIAWGLGVATTQGATDPMDPEDGSGWTKDAGNPLRAWDDSPGTRLNGASGAGATSITVDSTTGFAAEDPLLITDDATVGNYIYTRVRRVVSATELELYHSIDNIADNAPVHHGERGSCYAMAVAETAGGKFVLYGTHFRTFLPDWGTTYRSNSERSGRWQADAYDGPFSPGGLGDEPLPYIAGSVGRSNGWENMGLIAPPASLVAVTITKTASLDAALEAAGLTRTASLDAALQTRGLTKTLAADAALQAADVALSLALDGALQDTDVTRTLVADAVLKAVGLTKTALFDAHLTGGTSATITTALDAALLAQAQSIGTALDAALQLVGDTKTASLDAALQAAGIVRTALLDAALLAADLELTASFDAVLQDTGRTVAASLDAAVQAADLELTTALDAALQSSGVTRTLVADAVLKAVGLTKTAAFDAVLTGAGSAFVTTALDAALLAQALAISSSLDAALQLVGETKTASLDAALQAAALVRTAVFDAVLLKRQTRSTSFDAALQAPGQTLSLNFDARLITPATGVGPNAARTIKVGPRGGIVVGPRPTAPKVP